MTQPAMMRSEAARLLGLPVDADADAVRHAWRAWARLAHPDAGGDPEHFARLDRARRVMLKGTPIAADRVPPDPSRAGWIAPPRATLRSVLRMPERPVRLAVIALVSLGLAVLPAVVPPDIPNLALAAIPAAIAAAVWAVALTRDVLAPAADPGHRMAMLAVAWLPMCALQLAVSAVAGRGLISVLPLLALPLVAAVAAVNPGAGLWRPIGSGRTVPVR